MADWLERVIGSEPGFEGELVDRYTRRLLELARRQLPERVRRRVDPEDVVQSVYRSFFRRLNDGQFNFGSSGFRVHLRHEARITGSSSLFEVRSTEPGRTVVCIDQLRRRAGSSG